MRKTNKPKIIAISIAAIVVMLAGACTTVSYHRKKGQDYYKVGDYDKAVTYFQQDYNRHPKSNEAKVMLFRAKLKSYYGHLGLAREYRQAGKKEDAVNEYRIALGIFPLNRKLEEEYNDYMAVKKPEEKRVESTIVPPVNLAVDPGEKVTINLPSAPVKKIFSALGKSFNINFVFDKDFRDFVYSLEVENVGFYDILNQLCLVSSCNYRILDTSSVLIYPDSSFKKRTFELRGLKVFYLSNIKAEEGKKLLMTIFRDEQIQIQEDINLNSLIVKASFQTLVDIEKFLRNADKEKSEVEVDIQILEVNRSIINAIGADFSSPLSSVSAGSVGSDGKIGSTMNVTDLKDANFYITIPSAALRFLESDDNTKIISKPNLRGVNGEDIQFMVGEERPIPQTSFQSVAAGGVSTIPMTTYTYKNVGVEIKLTPFIHGNDEVTLKVKLTLNFVTGFIDAFPVLGKRELESVIRLKEGETNIIGGFIRDEVRGSLTGFPGFSRLPIIGRLFGSKTKEIKQSDLIFSITPRIIRRIDITKSNQETIWTNMQAVPEIRGKLEEPGIEEPRAEKRGGSTVEVNPVNRRMPVNTTSFFTIRLNSALPVANLTISGNVRGGKAVIEEVKTDVIRGPELKVFQNFAGESFDIGYSNVPETARTGVLAQMKIKFTQPGKYTVAIDNINATSKEGTQVEITASNAEVEVY